MAGRGWVESRELQNTRTVTNACNYKYGRFANRLALDPKGKDKTCKSNEKHTFWPETNEPD